MKFIALRMFIMRVLASQLPFQANKNAEIGCFAIILASQWHKNRGHAGLLSGCTVYSLYCAL